MRIYTLTASRLMDRGSLQKAEGQVSCGVTCPTAVLWQAVDFPHHIPNYESALAVRMLTLTNFLAGSELALVHFLAGLPFSRQFQFHRVDALCQLAVKLRIPLVLACPPPPCGSDWLGRIILFDAS